VLVPVLLAVLLLVGACSNNKDKGGDQGNKGNPGGGGNTSPIKEIMGKLTKGPASLTSLLGQELQADAPDWATIQSQTKEFAQLAASLGEHTPPKGSPESWKAKTTEYADSVVSLDKAAQAKDKAAALKVQQVLASQTTCLGCHREHRTMGPGGR
jgi:hypothetical protein